VNPKRNHFRSVLLLLFCPFFAAAADSPQDHLDLLAEALKKGDVKGALEFFDPAMTSFAELKRNIQAFGDLPNTYCAIRIVKTTQTADVSHFETDWSLQIYTTQNGPQLDRRDRVEMALRQSGDTWKIVSLSPVSVLAPPDGTIFSRIARFAADLNDKDQSGALNLFDSRMKQYGEIDNDIDALVTQNDVLCGIDIVSDRQTGAVHTLDLDWYLELKSRADGGPAQRRRERTQITVEQINGKWKITGIDSLKILSPFQN
jgi:ketosteroid isomerase-like protein